MRSNGFAGEGFPSPALLAFSSSPAPDPLPEDQDTGDLPTGVDEDALDADEIDTDRVTAPD